MAEKRKDDERSSYVVRAHAPDNLSPDELDECINIIKQGDAVNLSSAKMELPHAKVLAVVGTGGVIVGVRAVERLRPDYASKIAERSGVSFSTNTPELGYISVDREHKGHALSHRIVAELLSRHEGQLFATTSSERMKATLSKAGFVQKGREWRGQTGQLSLWLRN